MSGGQQKKNKTNWGARTIVAKDARLCSNCLLPSCWVLTGLCLHFQCMHVQYLVCINHGIAVCDVVCWRE